MPSGSNSQSSTASAVSENTEKLVAAPSKVAPSGYGVPDQRSEGARSVIPRPDRREVLAGRRRPTTSAPP